MESAYGVAHVTAVSDSENSSTSPEKRRRNCGSDLQRRKRRGEERETKSLDEHTNI
jgi:hypothetical protein